MKRPVQVGVSFLAAAAVSVAVAEPQRTIEETIRDSACAAEAQDAASARLAELYDADQKVREEGRFDGDAERRVEVAEIFASGCMRKGADFYHAAMIYQHGIVPEHYYQAYLWSKRAIELGDDRGAYLVPRAVDRYLMNRGMKQLFASNFVGNGWWQRDGKEREPFWCLWPVEPQFSDADRTAYGFRPLADSHARAAEMNEERGFIAPAVECPVEAAPPPKGLFPGIW